LIKFAVLIVDGSMTVLLCGEEITYLHNLNHNNNHTDFHNCALFRLSLYTLKGTFVDFSRTSV